MFNVCFLDLESSHEVSNLIKISLLLVFEEFKIEMPIRERDYSEFRIKILVFCL